MWQMSISIPGPFFCPVNIYTSSLDFTGEQVVVVGETGTFLMGGHSSSL